MRRCGVGPPWCGSNAIGWCKTEKFMNDRMTLATAMAISGATESANTRSTGLTRNRAVSALMALLNLRLGYWAPLPGPPRKTDGNWEDGPETYPRIRQGSVPNYLYLGTRTPSRATASSGSNHQDDDR